MRRDLLERVLRTCAELKDGEALVIVTDGRREPLATAFRDVASGMGIETTVVTRVSPTSKDEALAGYIEEALAGADLGLLVTNPWLARIAAQQVRLKRRRVRLLHLATATHDRLEYLLDLDYAELAERARLLCEGIRPGGTLRFVTPIGTDLRVQVAADPVRDVGLATTHGSFATLPAGEILIDPVGASATGTVVVDASMTNLGVLERPIRIKLEKGAVIDVDPPEVRHIMDPSRRDQLIVMELGIGLNPRAHATGSAVEDRRTLGSLQLTLATSIGPRSGKASVLPSVGIIRAPQVFIEDREVPRAILTAPAPVEVAPAAAAPIGVDLREFAAQAGELRSLHFDNSIEAQYVLDFETQSFLLVNRALESLTGYTREELLFGSVKAVDLVAPESLDTFTRKREQRRDLAADRYIFRLRTKSGDKKPIETCVQRVLVNGRMLVVGTLRDYTEQERRERTQKDKLYELAMNTSRVAALSEKIRSVPSLAHYLLHAEDERDILDRAGEIMCDRRGLAFLDVNIYLVKDGELVLSYSSSKKPVRRYDMKKDHKFVQIARGDAPPIEDEPEVVLQLMGRDTTLGLLQITLDQKEKSIIAGNDAARRMYQDVIRTLAKMMGIVLENARLYDTVRTQSVTDQLTRVYNRRYFDRKLSDEVKRALRYARDLSLVLIDVDHFKEINDTHGHKQGDVVLSEVADLFRKQSREVDVICRYGGDEFVLLLPETSLEQAVHKAENLRTGTCGHPFTSVVENVPHLNHLSLSIGVSSVGSEIRNEDDLLRAADEALYEAKRGGRNRVCVWHGKGALETRSSSPGKE